MNERLTSYICRTSAGGLSAFLAPALLLAQANDHVVTLRQSVCTSAEFAVTIEPGRISPYKKDSPEERAVQTLDLGAVRELAHVGGLHHQCVRMAA
jgi:hypothetical protein